jgi:ATP-dependent DNA ligase
LVESRKIAKLKTEIAIVREESLLSLRVRSIVVDGEAVWAGRDGKSDFDNLHSGTHDDEVLLYGFDLLELNSEDYRARPLEKRKATLEKILARTQGMQLSEHLDGDGEDGNGRGWGAETFP